MRVDPVGGCSMWEERFIDLEERLLVVDEEVKQIALVAHSEVGQLHTVLR